MPLDALLLWFSKRPRPAGVWRRAGTCHNADSPRTVAMTILPTQGLAAGSVRRIAVSLWQRCARPAVGTPIDGPGLATTRAGKALFMTKTILAEAVTRKSAVQKMTVASDG